ncbi:hypothetical protein E2542_SST12288 [Spatholobus suberectus]|nr:hypothetical protein E2542_SST31590 [Spatholobus suberectus]TKY62432.1 hypothetical protein E2542_SST12288 [Spatholobus suberectus]
MVVVPLTMVIGGWGGFMIGDLGNGRGSFGSRVCFVTWMEAAREMVGKLNGVVTVTENCFNVNQGGETVPRLFCSKDVAMIF